MARPSSCFDARSNRQANWMRCFDSTSPEIMPESSDELGSLTLGPSPSPRFRRRSPVGTNLTVWSLAKNGPSNVEAMNGSVLGTRAPSCE